MTLIRFSLLIGRHFNRSVDTLIVNQSSISNFKKCMMLHAQKIVYNYGMLNIMITEIFKFKQQDQHTTVNTMCKLKVKLLVLFLLRPTKNLVFRATVLKTLGRDSCGFFKNWNLNYKDPNGKKQRFFFHKKKSRVGHFRLVGSVCPKHRIFFRPNHT